MTSSLEHLAFFILICLAVESSASAKSEIKIGASDCTSGVKEGRGADYSSHFGPLRDQGDGGYCWGFTAAALYEEELCLDSQKSPDLKYQCGTSISAADVTSCNWPLATHQEAEGGSAFSAMGCAAEQGACEEKKAPYLKVRSELRAISKKVLSYRSKVEPFSPKACNPSQFTGDLEKFNEALVKILGSPTGLTSQSVAEENSEVLYNPEKLFYLMKSEVVGPACTSGRYKTSAKLVVDSPEESQVSKDGRFKKNLERVKSVLESGRSMAAEYCANDYDRSIIASGCAKHVLVIDGLRWNKGKKACEVQLRNSWGKGANPNGWISVDFLSLVTEIDSYKKAP